MLIDCDSCGILGAACSGCLVTDPLDVPAQVSGLDAAEHRAIEVFARAGFGVEVLPAPRFRANRPRVNRLRVNRLRAGRRSRAA